MKNLLFALVALATISNSASASDCKVLIRDLKKQVVRMERQNVIAINYVNDLGEYLDSSGQDMIRNYSSGQRIVNLGADLFGAGRAAMSWSSGVGMKNNTLAIDAMTSKITAIEDCISK